MSLFGDSMRPSTVWSDEAVRRYVESIRAELEPDPLFTRRLRGVIVNRFVAVREGMSEPVRSQPRSTMGRVGRASLYASVALAMTVGGAMAASQSSVPGDALYGLKRQIEELRMQVLPAEYRDELAAYALGERVNELAQLIEAGEGERATALAASIGEGYAQLAPSGASDGALSNRIAVLEGLLAGLPDGARAAIQRALNEAPGLIRQVPGQGTVGKGNADRPAAGGAAGGGAGATASHSASPRTIPKPAATDPPDEVQPTPKPTPKGKPSTSPRPIPSPRPTPSPHAGADSKGGPAEDPSD